MDGNFKFQCYDSKNDQKTMLLLVLSGEICLISIFITLQIKAF